MRPRRESLFTCARASSQTSRGASEHSAAQSRKLHRNPCATAPIANSRTSFETVLSLNVRPVGDGNTRPPPSSSLRASLRIFTARGARGTLCSSFAFMREAGTVQVAVSSSTSSQRAEDLARAAGGQDEELERERGGDRFYPTSRPSRR